MEAKASRGLAARGEAQYRKYRPLVEQKIEEFQSLGVRINIGAISASLGVNRALFIVCPWGKPITELIRSAMASQQGLSTRAERLIVSVVRAAVQAWNEQEAWTLEDYAQALRRSASHEDVSLALDTATRRGLLTRDARDLFDLYLPTEKAFAFIGLTKPQQEEAA